MAGHSGDKSHDGDQLSWENILSGGDESTASQASSASTTQASDPTAAATPKSPKPTTLSKRSKKEPEFDPQPKMSTQNWGKLEFTRKVSTPSTEVSTTVSGETKNALVEIHRSPQNEEDLTVEKFLARKSQVREASENEAIQMARVTEQPKNNLFEKPDLLSGRPFAEPSSKIPKPFVTMPVMPLQTAAQMPEIIEDPLPEETEEKEPQVISVTELNKNIKEILEGRFPLVWLKAEISNFKAHTSGHFYFSLKDAKSQINAVMFRGFNSQLKFRPEEGMEVIVRGRVTVYEPRGNYQIFCEVMEPVGAGALQKAFEQLKAKLQKEGLFDQARKRPLPALPRHIAIVTSPTGAAIRDMLNVLGRRFKGAQITLIPCRVQGDLAPNEIVQAIQLANKLKDVDVMIVGRGGGSIEDLWAFNEEKVARAIAASRIPTISAVGHEVDFTIADFVADLRAPTPSAAAELVVKNAGDLAQRIAAEEKRLKISLRRFFEKERHAIEALSKRLIDPQRRLQDASIRCDELLQRLENATLRTFADQRVKIELLREKLGHPETRVRQEREGLHSLQVRLREGMKNKMLRKQEHIARSMAVLDSLSPLRVVQRGYSLVSVAEDCEAGRGTAARDKLITDVAQVKVGGRVKIQFARGCASAEVKSIDNEKNVVE